MKNLSILIVDDNIHVVLELKEMIELWGYTVHTAFSAEEALIILERRGIDLVMSDHEMPGMKGIELLSHMQKQFEDVPFVMITGHGSIENAVIAMRQGAVDYLLKPCKPEELRTVIDRATQRARLSSVRREFKKHFSNIYGFEKIITRSSRMLQVIELASKIASIPRASVILYGETGTGKELLARGIHAATGCVEDSFVAVNCSGIPHPLLESELFGHVKGAFTGADSDREGKFGLAQYGTVLLDEIGDMPIDVQPKLLRVLEEGCYEKLGANKLIEADFRVVAATHHNLEKLIVYGKFRRDLFHRINRFPIMLPPLRERREDIPLLVNHFLEEYGKNMGRPVPEISRAAMRILEDRQWPGNVRELKNVLERAAIISEEGIIGPEQLEINSNAEETAGEDIIHFDFKISSRDFSLDAATEKIKEIILAQCRGNKSKAAEMLRINRKQFYQR